MGWVVHDPLVMAVATNGRNAKPLVMTVAANRKNVNPLVVAVVATNETVGRDIHDCRDQPFVHQRARATQPPGWWAKDPCGPIQLLR